MWLCGWLCSMFASHSEQRKLQFFNFSATNDHSTCWIQYNVDLFHLFRLCSHLLHSGPIPKDVQLRRWHLPRQIPHSRCCHSRLHLHRSIHHHWDTVDLLHLSGIGGHHAPVTNDAIVGWCRSIDPSLHFHSRWLPNHVPAQLGLSIHLWELYAVQCLVGWLDPNGTVRRLFLHLCEEGVAIRKGVPTVWQVKSRRRRRRRRLESEECRVQSETRVVL